MRDARRAINRTRKALHMSAWGKGRGSRERAREKPSSTPPVRIGSPPQSCALSAQTVPPEWRPRMGETALPYPGDMSPHGSKGVAGRCWSRVPHQVPAPMMTGSQTAAVETAKMVAIVTHDHQSFSAGAATATVFPFLREPARRTLSTA